MENISNNIMKHHKFTTSQKNERLLHLLDGFNKEKTAQTSSLKERIQKNNSLINKEKRNSYKRPNKPATKIIVRIDNIDKFLLKLLIIIYIFFPVFSSYNIIISTNFMDSRNYYKIISSIWIYPDEIYLNGHPIFRDDSFNSYTIENNYIKVKSSTNSTNNIEIRYHDYYLNSMEEMFKSCDIIKTVDFQNFDMQNINNMMGMFQSCFSLKKYI